MAILAIDQGTSATKAIIVDGPDVLGLNAATNDIGIVTLSGGAKFAIAVFLAGSALPEAQREAVHARVMAILAEAAR